MFIKIYYEYFVLFILVYTFTDKCSDYSNFPQKVKEQFAVYSVLGTGTFGEVRLVIEKVSQTQLNYRGM